MTDDSDQRRKLLDALANAGHDRVGDHSRPDLASPALSTNPSVVDIGYVNAVEQARLNIDTPIWPMMLGSGTTQIPAPDMDTSSNGPDFDGVPEYVGDGNGQLTTQTLWRDPSNHATVWATSSDPSGFVDRLNIFPDFAPQCNQFMPFASGSGSGIYTLSLIDASGAPLMTWVLTLAFTQNADTSVHVAFTIARPSTSCKSFNGATFSISGASTPANVEQYSSAEFWYVADRISMATL